MYATDFFISLSSAHSIVRQSDVSMLEVRMKTNKACDLQSFRLHSIKTTTSMKNVMIRAQKLLNFPFCLFKCKLNLCHAKHLHLPYINSTLKHRQLLWSWACLDWHKLEKCSLVWQFLFLIVVSPTVRRKRTIQIGTSSNFEAPMCGCVGALAWVTGIFVMVPYMCRTCNNICSHPDSVCLCLFGQDNNATFCTTYNSLTAELFQALEWPACSADLSPHLKLSGTL